MQTSRQINGEEVLIYDDNNELIGREVDGSYVPAKYPAEIMDELIKIRNTNFRDKMFTKTKGTVNGAFIGMLVGAAIGLYKRTNIFVAASLGALGGGLIGNIVTKKK